MTLPIGAFFESLVRWLKAQFGGFFDFVSSIINSAITFIENVVSVDPSVWYSSPLVILLISVSGFGIASKHGFKRYSWIIAVVALVTFGSLDLWKKNILGTEILPETAIEVSSKLTDYHQTLLELNVGAEAQLRDLERVITRFERVEGPIRRSEVIGLRNYERLQGFLQSILIEEADGGREAGLRESTLEIRRMLSPFAPNLLAWYAWFLVTLLFVLLAWLASGIGLALFALIGFSLIQGMGFWSYTTDTIALVLSATGFALLLGVPLGIAAAANRTVDQISRPILDFMQTMPAFVYLIPAVLLFGLGKVPGAMATLIFAMPPAVRLTSLGIRSVPEEVVEAAQSFGATSMQLLYKAQLPIAMPTILAGLNQTIMLSLSMVVIGGMIGAGGLGEVVLSGITQLQIGLGFESGLSVVILAIYLDRLTQALGNPRK